MDFITQNLLGAVAAQATVARKLGRWTVVPGALGGAVPDFDFLLKPFADPAAPYEYHRHLTHALAFIPIGAVLATIPCLLIPALRRHLGLTFLAALIGCATHGLLDNLTSYGTHLYWPFIAERTSWDTLSIIDPIVTVPLFLAVLLTLILGRMRPAVVGAAWFLAYTAFAAVQHGRAADIQEQLAAERGHEIANGRVMPSIGNAFLWRSIYRDAAGVMHADGIHLGWTPLVRRGTSMAVFLEAALPSTVDDERRDRVVECFSEFADGFVGVASSDATSVLLGDMRFSFDVAAFAPIWGTEVLAAPSEEPVRWSGRPSDRGREYFAQLWESIVRPREMGYRPFRSEP